MDRKPPPLVPDALPLASALARSEPLALLRRRLAESERRFDAIRPLLPQALRELVAPGPLDETHWTLLVRNTAAAAKLRQLAPRLEQALHERGWQGSPIRIRVQPGA